MKNLVSHLLAGLLEQALQRSWCIADRTEQKHRLRTITTLILELEKIKAVSIQATAFAEATIERVIEGDWHGVEVDIREMRLPESGEDQWGRDERLRGLWENFITAAETAVAEEHRLQPGVRPKRN